MQRDKQSPLELIKYTGYIQESFGRMRVRVVVVVGERERDAIRVLQHYYMFADRGLEEKTFREYFLCFFCFFLSCVGVKEQLEAALAKT